MWRCRRSSFARSPPNGRVKPPLKSVTRWWPFVGGSRSASAANHLRIDPHVLTEARRDLQQDGTIRSTHRDTTRYTLAATPVALLSQRLVELTKQVTKLPAERKTRILKMSAKGLKDAATKAVKNIVS